MSLEHIVQALVTERDRLNRAIEALGGGQAPKRRGRPPKNALANAPEWVTGNTTAATSAKKKRGGRTFTPEQKAAQAERMKAMWAKRKTAAKKAK